MKNLRRKVNRTFYKEVDVAVEIECDDVIEYIRDYASDDELEEIRESLAMVYPSSLADVPVFKYNDHEGTTVQSMKFEFLQKAANKYSLAELEEKLGIIY